ncbi:conserved hypothetical protein [Thermoplasma acidophilum]|uniref:Uncharacterized protein n=1 Tax=Thermoplasma acidophilum (strain ATCC 25905 / DSM 1728 / JCM 9062 / NBRC 15155 / AMRC-C165) TaxID=273075 RepID=Q9HIB4_THEAC|nr:conserved hypothetical protein [Thermoplasma acidophilum]
MITTRAAGVTAAAGTRLAQPLFLMLFRHQKSLDKKSRHSGSPCRAFAHCTVFAPAAPRRAWTVVSESISGLPLSGPVPVLG